MVEETEVSLQADEELDLNTQTVGEKRENGFLETASNDQSMCMPNFMTSTLLIEFIMYVDGDVGRHAQAAVSVDTAHNVGVQHN